MYRKHGLSKSPEYRCWQQLKSRCLNPNHRFYPNYGGRGIGVHPEWVDDFESFFAHVGPRPTAKHSLDRLDNDGGYIPGNVAWRTQSDQLRNRRKFGSAVKTSAKTPGRKTNFKHGLIDTPEYKVWSSMKDRCLNPNSSNYDRWGARGITIHSVWIDDFLAFLECVGNRPSPTHSLDRIDNDGNYEPGNVRWATKQEQSENRGEFITGPEHGNYKHGLTGSPEHKTWGSIKTRCFNANTDRYKDYGGKGITMCQRWRSSLEAFVEDLGVKPTPKHSIMRLDLERHYSCGKCEECLERGWGANCRWATRTEVNRNRRPSERSGKLTPEKVARMRALLAEGIPQPVVAQEFGVGVSLVGKIKRRESWA